MRNISDIVKTLYQERESLVPIIGDEMFVVAEGKDEIPLQSYIVDYFESQDKIFFQSEDVKIFGTRDQLLKEMKSQGYYGMTILYNHLSTPNTLKNSFKAAISEFYSKYRDKIHLKSSVKNFLCETNYPVIITTSPFDIIEKDLNYKISIFYDIHYGNDEDIIEANNCVFHLFGPNKKGKTSYETSLRNGEYVTNENELLFFLHAINRFQPAKLKEYLDGKFLFVLGCCLPNWFFRFLLYPINTANEIYLINNEETSIQLDYYLNSVGYNKLYNVDEILELLNTKIILAQEERFVNTVFLSIADEDAKQAEKLKEMLQSTFGIKVWLYSEEKIFGKWFEEIKTSLNRSKYLMPYVTEHYLNKLATPRNKINPSSGLEKCLYDIAEPRVQAEERKENNSFILPILKKGTRYKGKEVSFKTLDELASNEFCAFPSFFKGLQYLIYQEDLYESKCLEDHLDPNGYKILQNLLRH